MLTRPRRRRLSAMLVPALALLLASTLAGQPEAAAANGQQSVYFPWVLHNVTIGGHGPWSGEFTVQNLGNQPCAVHVFVSIDGEWVQRAQLSVGATTTRTYSTRILGFTFGSAPARFDAFCDAAITLKQSAPRPIAPPWSDGATVVTGYSGLSDADIGAQQANATTNWYLPIVQTNSDWNTLLRVTNFDEEPIDVTVELYPTGNLLGAAGVERVIVKEISVAGTLSIDALAEVGPEWVGYARISTSGKSAVIAHRLKLSAMMALTNVAVAVDGMTPSGTFRAQAPLLFNAYNGWNTGITLANTTDELAFVTIRYYEVDGEEPVDMEQFVIPGRGMTFIYTPGTVEVEGFVGSATIVSSVPLVSAVDEVKYETVEALSYMASSVPQTDAALPVVFRENPMAGRHNNSGISIASFKEDGVQLVSVTLLSTSGQLIGDSPYVVSVPPSGVATLYLPFLDSVPPGTIGSAHLTSQDAAGFVAISNDINYAVIGDGSVAWVAANSAGYYHVPPPLAP